ncbi:GvpL/GvpF family gas vesicle protein [Streptomyces sp. NPDC015127]|uniref:GvpL/GvpF family gas vesicle protein n=1 Tax=Streptomyces sp. NPDC015127 TaxID=3364939 RepID=UPI0037024554
MSDLVLYAYAVAHDAEGLADSAATLIGVAGAPVHLMTATRDGRLLLVVSPVRADDFQEAALKRHLEDLRWLEAVARAHHAVVDALAARTTVLPLRLATVYLDDDSARNALDRGAPAFGERLTRLAGHHEWGVKIYADPSAGSSDPAPAPAEAADLSPGRAYLRRRKAQQSVRDDVYRAAGVAAERVEAAGRRHAAGRARHRVQQGALAASADENVVNDAYLVHRNRTEAFRAEVALAADGLLGVRVEVTGPWAPYSFAAPAAGSDDSPDDATP